MAGIQPTPAEAWKRLRDGNRRFIEGSNEHPTRTRFARTGWRGSVPACLNFRLQ